MVNMDTEAHAGPIGSRFAYVRFEGLPRRANVNHRCDYAHRSVSHNVSRVSAIDLNNEQGVVADTGSKQPLTLKEAVILGLD